MLPESRGKGELASCVCRFNACLAMVGQDCGVDGCRRGVCGDEGRSDDGIILLLHVRRGREDMILDLEILAMLVSRWLLELPCLNQGVWLESYNMVC